MTEYSRPQSPPEKVIDESDDEPITRIYPTYSVCSVPQMLAKLANG